MDLASLTGTIESALRGVSLNGFSISQLASGVAQGVFLWVQSLVVPMNAVGLVGVGSVSFPFTVPPGGLNGTLTANLAPFGTMAPILAQGLGIGITAGLATGLIIGAVPGVGTGTAIVRFQGTAVPHIVAGFASRGLVGTQAPILAQAIGAGIDTFFAAYTLVVPVVGGSGAYPSTTIAIGRIQ
jgi:hypothetical protein